MIRLLLFTCTLFAHPLYAQSLTVKFTNVRNNAGVFRVGFFTDEKSYKSGDPVYYKTIPKTNLNNGTLIYTFNDISSGTYGLVVLDDENENDKTDYTLFIPNEGFGFSNYPIVKVQIPKFEDFDFLLGDVDLLVTVQLKYL